MNLHHLFVHMLVHIKHLLKPTNYTVCYGHIPGCIQSSTRFGPAGPL